MWNKKESVTSVGIGFNHIPIMDGTDYIFNIADERDNVNKSEKGDNSNQPYSPKDLRRTLDELSPTDNITQNMPVVKNNSMQNLKQNTKKEQLNIINQNNPAPNKYLTWIRTEDDIKTFSEALEDSDYKEYDEFSSDYTRKMAEQALRTGKITVYSSYPITQGTFVTPSKMEAESYSGTGKVYEKTVDIKDVAWIDPTQGQYARVEEGKKSIAGARLSELVEKYGAIPSGEKPKHSFTIPTPTKQDADTTPQLEKRQGRSTRGDSISSFADNIERSSWLDEDLKERILSDEGIVSYNRIANADTLSEALDKLENGGAGETSRLTNLAHNKKSQVNETDVAETKKQQSA